MTPLRKVLRVFGKRSGAPIRTLIADDEPQVRGLLRRTFETDGRFDVVGEATDGAEAVNQVASMKPDVLILDLAMPNINGIQAIPDLLKASPDTRIVVFSSMAPFSDTATQALEMGAALVLDKYTPPRKLIKAVVGLVR